MLDPDAMEQNCQIAFDSHCTEEDLLVGYQCYEVQKEEPLFAFGNGLSYTTYRYSNKDVAD